MRAGTVLAIGIRAHMTHRNDIADIIVDDIYAVSTDHSSLDEAVKSIIAEDFRSVNESVLTLSEVANVVKGKKEMLNGFRLQQPGP